MFFEEAFAVAVATPPLLLQLLSGSWRCYRCRHITVIHKYTKYETNKHTAYEPKINKERTKKMIDDDVDGFDNELKPSPLLPFNAFALSLSVCVSIAIGIDMETMQSAPRAKYNFIHFR